MRTFLLTVCVVLAAPLSAQQNVPALQFESAPDFFKLPPDLNFGEVSGVAVDSNDNVHVFTRMEHPYLVFDKNGKMVDRWGEGIFEDAHGICITPDDKWLLSA